MNTQEDTSMDINQIMSIIPHRYPFLLIDRIKEIILGEFIIGIKNVTFNEPQFTGHFPSRPIMPGVLIIEAMAQLSAVLVAKSMETTEDKKGFFTELEARVRYGVPAHLLDLCNIPNIGKVRAKKLYDFGIKSKDDFKKTDIDTLVKVINLKKSIVEDVLKSLD